MEFVDGLTLTDAWNAPETPDLRKRIKAASDLLEAVAQLHARKMIHDDLKPDNLMIERDGKLRIIDIGLHDGDSDELMKEAKTAIELSAAIVLNHGKPLPSFDGFQLLTPEQRIARELIKAAETADISMALDVLKPRAVATSKAGQSNAAVTKQNSSRQL